MEIAPHIEQRIDAPPDLAEAPNQGVAELAEASNNALRQSFEDFAIDRGRDLAEGEAADAELSSIDLFKRGLEKIEANYSLLEDIQERDPNGEKPDCTVCIPIAVMVEDPKTVVNTVNIIKRAQQATGRAVELILWTNAKHSGDETGNAEIEAVSRVKYEMLKTQLAGLTGDGLHIQTALQINEEDAGISTVRSNYMDAAALQAVKNEYGYEHPVVWIDADIKTMAKSTLADLSDGVRRFDALFMHANSQFSIDWADGPLAVQDDATKAIALTEIKRRQLARMNKTGPAIHGAYTEEWGLAFAMGTYLEARGVDTSVPTDESHTLLLNTFAKSPREIPTHLFGKRKIQSLITVKRATLNASARGLYDAVQREGLSVIPAYDRQVNSTVRMFTERDPGDARPVAIEPQELRDLMANDFGKIARMERNPRRYGYESSEEVVAAWGLMRARQDQLLKKYF